MQLSEQQKDVLNMPLKLFITRYVNNTRYASALCNAASTLKSCSVDDAKVMPMKSLVQFSKQEWRSCNGIGGKCLCDFEDAYEKTGLDFCMILPDNLNEESMYSDSQPSNEQVMSIFQTLQDEMVLMGSSKTEFKMLRPDGYTWVISILPPEHPDALKKDEDRE